MIQAAPIAEDDIERLLDVREVSARLGISEKTVWVMSNDGRFLKPMHLGRLTRWRVRDFNRWVRQQATKRGKADDA